MKNINKMTDKELAESKINRMKISDYQKEFALADWPNADEHYKWILTADESEIIDWIETGLR